MKPKPTISVEEFLNPFPKKIKLITEELRRLIKESVPEYNEAVYTGWKLIGYRVKQGNKSFYFGFIAPLEDKVVLGFEYGANINDPYNILTGKGKQVKQIEVKNIEEINEEIFKELINEAVMLALVKKQK